MHDISRLGRRLAALVVVLIAALSLAGCFHSKDEDEDKGDAGKVAGGQTTPATPSTAPSTAPSEPEPSDTGGRSQETDIAGIERTIVKYFDAGRKGNPTEWCGQQSDGLLEKNFGGLEECIESDIASKPDSDIPPGRDLDFENSITLDGDDATAEPRTTSGSTKYTIELVYEGANGGWAVDSIDNNT